MQLNYTFLDLLATLFAVLIFPLFIVVPGYVLGYWLNLASFRERTPLLRILLSLPLSVALTPVIVYLLGRQFSTASIWPFYGVLWIGFVAMIVSARSRASAANPFAGKFPHGIVKPLTIISAVWIAVTVLSLIDLQFGHKLFFSVVSYDYTVRSAAIGQLARVPWLPPSSPFFFPGHPAPFRYHYFWFLLCAMPVRLFPALIGPRPALFAGVVWIGFTLMATVALYLRLFESDGERQIRRRTLMAIGLLSVSGLDILPILFFAITRTKNFAQLYPSVDWWNADQVTGWLDSCLWVPHHLAGLLACMTGFLILWVERNSDWKRLRWQTILGAGLAFASAGGLSVYVAFAFAAFLLVWTLLTLFRRHPVQVATLVAVAVVAGLLGAPFIHDLAAAGSSGTTGKSASFMKLGIRRFGPAHMLMFVLHRETTWSLRIVDFLSLPINFFFELGALFVVGLIRVRQWLRREIPFSSADLASVVMLGVCFFIGIFIRSNTIQMNDLGIRAMLIVQFVLLLWGADLLNGLTLRGGQPGSFEFYARVILVGTLVLGAITNVYELGILRTYTVLTEAGLDRGVNIINPGKNFGASALANRQLYEYLNSHVPRSAVEQHNPSNPYNPLPGLYSNRQMAMADMFSASAFGGDPKESDLLQSDLGLVFGAGANSDAVDQICRKYKIDYFVVRSDDPVWNDPKSWVWSRHPVYANSMARAFACQAKQ